jgi:hypothetical protein
VAESVCSPARSQLLEGVRRKYLGGAGHPPHPGGGAEPEPPAAAAAAAEDAEPEAAAAAAAAAAAGRGLRLSLPHCAAEAGLPCLRALWSPDPRGEAGPYQQLPADALSLDHRPNDDANAAANAPRPVRRQPSVTVRLSQPVRTIGYGW